MDFEIRNIQISDKDEIFQMMEEFYSSDAVSTNGSGEIFNTDFQNCISDFPYLEGFVFEKESEILGYSMISKSFSTSAYFSKLPKYSLGGMYNTMSSPIAVIC